MSERKAKANRLEIGEYFKLADWLRQQHPGLVAARRTYTDAAVMATRDLKLEVNAGHVARVAEELGLLLASPYSKKGCFNGDAKLRMELLEKRVAHLYSKLGEVYPE
jgi:hypothetical protein